MTDRAQLETDVNLMLARDDISDVSFDLVLRMAEARIARNVQTIIQETSTTLEVSGRTVAAPARFLGVRMIYVDDTNQVDIDYLTPDVIRRKPQWREGGPLKYYTLEGNLDDEEIDFVFAPAGNATTPTDVELLFHRRFAALEEDDDTNWLLTNHYDVYLYACLRAAAQLVQEDALEDRYKADFGGAVEELNRHENRKRYGSMAKQASGSPRTIV